jgi:hypothetical protein
MEINIVAMGVLPSVLEVAHALGIEAKACNLPKSGSGGFF